MDVNVRASAGGAQGSGAGAAPSGSGLVNTPLIDPALDGPASPEHAASNEYAAVTIYEHVAWFQFLLPACLPGAARLRARLGETAADVLARLDPACKMFVFHVNLTSSVHVPLDRAVLVDGLRARGIAVRNAQLVDISKRWTHAICERAGMPSLCAQRDGDPDEHVIVKTNSNYHGKREAELTVAQRQVLGLDTVHELPRREDAAYRVVLRREVQDEIWASPLWVVERYITNAAHRFHRVYIAGDAMVVSAVFDPSIFKKMPEGIERETYYMKVSDVPRPPAVPADIAAVAGLCARIARSAGADYGALDVVSDDRGGYYVIDINSTPHWGVGGHPILLSYLGAGLAGAHRAG